MAKYQNQKIHVKLAGGKEGSIVYFVVIHTNVFCETDVKIFATSKKKINKKKMKY